MQLIHSKKSNSRVNNIISYTHDAYVLIYFVDNTSTLRVTLFTLKFKIKFKAKNVFRVTLTQSIVCADWSPHNASVQ